MLLIKCCWTWHIHCRGETNNFNSQRSAKLLIVLQGDWATGEEKYSPEKKKPLRSCCFPSRELETLVLSRQSLRTKQWCSPSYILPHCRTNPVLIAPMSDLVWIQPRVRWCQKKSQGINKVCRLSGCPEWQNKILCNSIKLISEILCEAQISHCLLTYSVSQCVRPWIKFTPEYPFKVFWVQRHMLVNVAGLQWLNLANL